MGFEFEKLKKKNFPTDQPIPVKQGWVRGETKIFYGWPNPFSEMTIPIEYIFRLSVVVFYFGLGLSNWS